MNNAQGAQPVLPPLPPAAVDEHNLQGGRLLYTRSQMHAYARAALAAQQAAEQTAEPVAWMHVCRKKPELRELLFSKHSLALASMGYKPVPLYTHAPATPPQAVQPDDYVPPSPATPADLAIYNQIASGYPQAVQPQGQDGGA